MPKHPEKNPHPKGAAKDFASSADDLIGRLVKDKNDKARAIHEIENEGPAHKQVYSALLLQRMTKLVQAVETKSGQTFTPQEGVLLSDKKSETSIPIPLPASVVKKENIEKLSEVLAHAPAHELVAFNTLLQAIEWSIVALD